jgi:hypothetical protein
VKEMQGNVMIPVLVDVMKSRAFGSRKQQIQQKVE